MRRKPFRITVRWGGDVDSRRAYGDEPVEGSISAALRGDDSVVGRINRSDDFVSLHWVDIDHREALLLLRGNELEDFR